MKIKTRKIALCICILALFAMTLSLSACGGNNGDHTHEFSEWSEISIANCWSKGREMSTCTCGAVDYRDTDYAHSYVHIDGLDPTHDEQGYREHEKCENCNATVGYEIIPALGCTSSTKASCTHVEYCDTCQTFIQYAAHSFKDGVCTECGEVELTAGLTFELKFDGEYYYSVVGISTSANYVVIPNVYNGLKVKEIAPAAFENDQTVEKVYIPSNVQAVGDNAFYNCSKLEAIFISSKAAPAITGDNWKGGATLYFDGNFTLTGNVASVIVADTEADGAYDLYIKCLNAIADNYTAVFSHAYDVGLMQFTGAIDLKVSGNTRYGFEETSSSVMTETYVTKIETYYNDGYLYSNLIMQDGVSYNAKQYSTLPITQFMTEKLTDGVVIPSRLDFAKCVVTDNGDGTITVVLSTDNGYTAAEIAAFIDFESIPLDMDLSTILAVPGANASVTFIMDAECTTFSVELEMSCVVEDEGTSYNMSYESSTVYSDIGTTAEQTCANKEEYTLHTHTANTDNTCSEVKCRSCGNVIKEAAPHKYEQYSCTGATCSVCGETITAEIEHIYKDGLCIYCEYNQPSYGLTYEISSDGEYYILTGLGTFDGKDVVVPSHYKGLPVKKIKAYAFASNGIIESIVLPEGMTTIGESAFTSCTALKAVILPDSVTSIGSAAFAYCTAIESLTLSGGLTSISNSAFSGCTAITTVEIPEGVTSLGNNTFYSCNSLKTLVIPSSVSSMGESVFANCTALETVTITNGVTTIGVQAFSGCTALKTITVPDSVTSMGKGAFRGCTALESITLPFTGKELNGDSDTSFSYIFVVSWSDSVPESLKEVTITKSVPNNAFYTSTSYYNIERIILADDVTSIGNYAFYGFNKLEEVVASGVTSIGEFAFSGCKALNNVVLNSVVSIGYRAFQQCESLVNITLPASLTESSADFSSCLENVYYGGTLADWCNITFVNAYESNPMAYAEHFYMLDENDNWYEVTEIVIPDTVTSIPSNQFYGFDNLKKIVIPNTVTSIGNYALEGCFALESITMPYVMEGQFSKLFNGTTGYSFTEIIINGGSIIPDAAFSSVQCKKIVLPEGIASIGKDVFQYNRLLTSIMIPESVTSIGNNAFRGCTSLTSITIPASVTSIGNNAFYDCTSLTSITIPASVTSIGSGAFYDCTALEEINFNAIAMNSLSSSGYVFANAGQNGNGITVRIGKNVTKIPAYLFYAGSSSPKMASVEFEEGSVCEEIGNSAFRGCTSLTSITIPESVNSIGDRVFRDCTSLASVDFADNSLLTSIGYEAFYNCTSLVSITIPEGMTSIGTYAFYNCTALEEVNFNAIAMTDLSSSGSVFANAGQNGNGITVKVGKNVTKIPAYLFYAGSSSPKMASVEFEEGSVCESIGDYAFSDCTFLTSITIPESVTSIGDYAFYNCTALEEINFNATSMNDLSSNNYVFANAGQSGNGITVKVGKKVTKIPADLFYPCYDYSPKITSVVFEEDSVCEAIGSYAFYNCTSLRSITIPESVTSIGKIAFDNCTSLTEITIPTNVTSIGDSVFKNCTSLTSITIPASVTSIGHHAFYDCTSLTSMTIPENVTSIGDYAFYNCTALEEINFNAVAMTDLSSSGSVFANAGQNGNGITVRIGKNVTKIPAYLFYAGNSSPKITSVVFEEGSVCEAIGNYAFYYCTTLTSVTIPENVTSIGNYAFYNCTALEEIYFNATSMNDLSSNNYVFAFAGQNGNGIIVKVGKNVTKIPAYLFCAGWGSTKITSVVFEEGSVCEAIGNYAFYDCTSLTSITIPESVTSIGNYTFNGCTSLASIEFGDYSLLTSIGNGAFYDCTSLTSMTIPESVTSIGNYAFYGCTSLTSIVFENTDTWYKTSSEIYWSNKTKGDITSVTDASTNVTYFKDKYYWYKL